MGDGLRYATRLQRDPHTACWGRGPPGVGCRLPNAWGDAAAADDDDTASYLCVSPLLVTTVSLSGLFMQSNCSLKFYTYVPSFVYFLIYISLFFIPSVSFPFFDFVLLFFTFIPLSVSSTCYLLSPSFLSPLPLTFSTLSWTHRKCLLIYFYFRFSCLTNFLSFTSILFPPFVYPSLHPSLPFSLPPSLPNSPSTLTFLLSTHLWR